MYKQPITPELLAASVIAVPPVARHADDSWNASENAKLIKYLEAGGVTTLLYGGNAALPHVSCSEYAGLLDIICEHAAPETLLVPSIGPSYGQSLDQIAILKNYNFPTVMLLPTRDSFTAAGLATGIRRCVDRLGKPIVLYLKHDGMLDVETVQRLYDDGLVSWIKYAIVRSVPQDDTFLKSLVDAIGTERVVSGMGEQPAITHLNNFGLIGFTSGCVCVAPRKSTQLLKALKSGDLATAESLRQQFAPLENLRDTINPVRVLHAAVALAGISDTGPITPFWSPVDAADAERIATAARDLKSADAA